jgi:hypothetical protein
MMRIFMGLIYTKMICTLASLRDTLLPKLMRGEVRIANGL